MIAATATALHHKDLAESAAEDISTDDAITKVDFRVDGILPAVAPRAGLGGSEEPCFYIGIGQARTHMHLGSVCI